MEIKTSQTHRTCDGFDVRGEGSIFNFCNCQVIPLIEVGNTKGIPVSRGVVVVVVVN